MSKNDFINHRVNISKFTPIRDEYLISAETINKEGNDLVDTGKITHYFKFIQNILAVPEANPLNLKIGDQVMVDMEHMSSTIVLQKSIVVMNDSPDNLYLRLPSRYIQGIVTATEVEPEPLNPQIDE
jgi:hypothetical protein